MDARVAVVGAGPTGAAIVAGLARAGIDAIGFDSQAGVAASGKTVVLRAAAMRTLREWGIAPGADLACPIRDARVDFENTPMRARLRPPRGLGFAVDLSEWHRALRAEIESKIVAPARVLAIRQTAREAQIDLSENRVCRAQAVVVAAPLPLPTEFATRDFDYGQSALTMTAAIDGISAGRAWERIGGDGVFALVPRADGRFGVICCASAGRIDRLCALPDDALCARLQARFVGLRFADLRARFAYPLRLQTSAPLAAGRVFLAGQGAAVLHPIGALGLNLGLADAAALVRLLGRYFENKESIESIGRAYRRARRCRHLAAIAATSALALAGARR